MYYHFNVEYGDKSVNRIADLNHNAGLIMRYPFLLPRNLQTDEVPKDYDFSYTEIDLVPRGWRIAFENEMLEELSEILKEADYVDSYRILDIKEKFGGLAWYSNDVPQEISNKYYAWENKYIDWSVRTCICCGNPTTLGILCSDCLEYCTTVEIKDQ